MDRPARRPFRRSERWRCVLPPTVSITGKKSRHRLIKSSPSHEPMASGEGEETPSRTNPDRMDGCLAKWVSSPSYATGLAELHLCLSRQRRSWPSSLSADSQENGTTSRGSVRFPDPTPPALAAFFQPNL